MSGASDVGSETGGRSATPARGGGAVSHSSDYFSNHANAERFPFSVYHAPIASFMRRELERLEGARDVVNLGCGFFPGLRTMPPRHRYVGADIDARVVEAMSKAPVPHGFDVRFVHVDGATLPFADASVDLVFATEVIEHVDPADGWLAEIRRVLRSGGRIALSTPNYGSWQLPLVESTFLEAVARLQGFSRKGIHPNRYGKERLARELAAAGFADARVTTTPLQFALCVAATRP